jgi:hypothetical protein
MRPVPINQLAFKGTHNSYQCTSGTNPVMNHPIQTQIDDFGVWGVEIDVGPADDSGAGNVGAAVGHDGPGDGVCAGAGVLLTDYLIAIRNTIALKFRPVFIYFETKAGDDWADLDPLDSCDDHAQKFTLVISALQVVFGSGNYALLNEFLQQNGGRYPTVPETAGKIVVYYPNPEYSGSSSLCGGRLPFRGTLVGTDVDNCTSREAIVPLPPQVFRVDQYQADWTFDYGVPPNPFVVDGAALPPWPVVDSIGDSWSCDNADVSHGEVVAEQGTYRFPFRTVGRAITRAEGTTSNGYREFSRAGYGWTVIIQPNTYSESIRIDTPLILVKGSGPGNVVIVGQRGRIVRSLWITFRTNDDNKNPDTMLCVQVISAGGRICARYQQSRLKEYKEQFSHTEQLLILGPVFQSELSGAILTIDIVPNGRDTWRFNYSLDGTWSDGTQFSDQQFFISLNQDSRHFEKQLTL